MLKNTILKLCYEPGFVFGISLILTIVALFLKKVRFKMVIKIYICFFSLYLFLVLSFELINSNSLGANMLGSFIYFGIKSIIVLTIFLLLMGVHLKIVIKISICLILSLYFWLIGFIVIDIIANGLYVDVANEDYAIEIFRNFQLAFSFFFVFFNLWVLYYSYKTIILPKEIQFWYLIPLFLSCWLCIKVLDYLSVLPFMLL